MRLAVFILILIGLVVLYRVFSARAQRPQTTQSHKKRTTPDLMQPEEAAALLGLEAGFTQDDIIEAHRKLMQKVHPDKGGSVALAQQLNEAKRVLLKEKKS